MGWKDVGKAVSKFAPLLGGALLGPGGAAIGGIVANVFGADSDSPEDVLKAIQVDPQAAVKLKEIESNKQIELERLAVERARNIIAAETAQLTQVAMTYQAELKQEDKYVKRWRPTFGYAVVFSWVIMWCAVVGTILFQPESAADVITALTGTAMMWSVALAVLGVNVYKRSQDKEVAAGFKPGILTGMLKKEGAT